MRIVWFGRIVVSFFQYVRLADNTPMEDVVELLLSHWRIDKPVRASLVITVVGGAKNFKLDGKKKEIFNRGLVNVRSSSDGD